MSLSNPIRIHITASAEGMDLSVDLTPDAIGLRARYRALIVHLHNVPEPIFWDLRKDMKLIQKAVPLGAPERICITVYGVLPDDSMRLLFRNWGDPADGLPL